MFKRKQAVRGRTVSGRPLRGHVALVSMTASGLWVRVRLKDGTLVATRESLLRAA